MIEIKESNCPGCGKKLDAVSAVDKENLMPKEHDVTICLGCGTVLEFTSDLGLIKATDVILAGMDPEDKLQLEQGKKYVAAYLEHRKSIN